MSDRKSDEKLILEQFRAYTGNDRIVATDDFFCIGGDSFVAVRVARALSEVLARDVEPRELFTHRTARALAVAVAGGASPTSRTAG